MPSARARAQSPRIEGLANQAAQPLVQAVGGLQPVDRFGRTGPQRREERTREWIAGRAPTEHRWHLRIIAEQHDRSCADKSEACSVRKGFLPSLVNEDDVRREPAATEHQMVECG